MLADLGDDLAVSRHLTRLSKFERSPFSIAKERSQLLAIGNLAKKRGLLDCVFEVVAPVLPKKVPRAWLPEEVGRLMEAIDCLDGNMPRPRDQRTRGIPKRHWWKALHFVMWDTGERISALMAVRFEWVSIDGWLHIPAQVRKGKRGDMLFRLSPETLEAIEIIRNPQRDLIFPWHQAPNHIYYHYSRILERAGLEDDQGKFHRMRKTVASLYKAAGHDPQRLLDHADARTTSKYLDPRIVPQVQPCDVIPAIPKRRRAT
jgi:integrase